MVLHVRPVPSALVLMLGLCACSASFSEEEAGEVAAEMESYTAVTQLLAATVDLATQAQPLDTPEGQAATLKAYLDRSLRCAAVDLEGPEVSIRFGVNDPDCSYLGVRLTGIQTLTFMRPKGRDVLAQVVAVSTLEGVNNGRVSVSGDTNIRWAPFENADPLYDYDIRYTDLVGNHLNNGSGTLVHTRLQDDKDEVVGIQATDVRSWRREGAKWRLSDANLTVHFNESVPRDGRIASLQGNAVNRVEVAFSQEDEDTIEINVSSGQTAYAIPIKSTR